MVISSGGRRAPATFCWVRGRSRPISGSRCRSRRSSIRSGASSPASLRTDMFTLRTPAAGRSGRGRATGRGRPDPDGPV